jgi:hypothetical protein
MPCMWPTLLLEVVLMARCGQLNGIEITPEAPTSRSDLGAGNVLEERRYNVVLNELNKVTATERMLQREQKRQEQKRQVRFVRQNKRQNQEYRERTASIGPFPLMQLPSALPPPKPERIAPVQGDYNGPKVAFMFLTRGNIKQEELWQAWFGKAVPNSYSIYVHASPDYKWPEGAFFGQFVIADPV